MKGRWLWVVIGANLLVLVVLAFVYPHVMVSPGPVVPAQAALATDCFACHTPLRGATADRCTRCHALPDIGLTTLSEVAGSVRGGARRWRMARKRRAVARLIC